MFENPSDRGVRAMTASTREVLGATPSRAAADRAALSYQVEGLIAGVEDLDFGVASGIPAVVVPSLRRVELVVGEDTNLGALAEAVPAHFPDTGWSVWILAPLHRLTDAHSAFSSSTGCVERLQGWWLRPDQSVTFTEPQLP